MTGKVKTITDKGFGFISNSEAEGDDNDIFFHSSALEGITMDELQEGDEVTFEVEDSDKGPRAVSVTKA